MTLADPLLDDAVLEDLSSMGLLEELVSIYAAEASEVLAAIERALAAGSADAARASAHKLKGMAAHCGARRLSAVAASVEKAASRGELAACEAALATLRAVESETAAGLRARLSA